MPKLKEFSVLKWIIFPLNSIVLSAVIAWFNLSVFGWEDGAPYVAIVALIGLFSIIVVKYAESTDKTLARAAFVFEVFLTVALIINAAYSISVQRKMSVARMAEQSQADTIDRISKLRGSRTQREALRVVAQTESAQSVFANVEAVLFWIAVGELALYGLSAFVLFALARLRDDDEPEAKDDEFPNELEVKNRLPVKRQNFTTQKEPAKNHGSFDSAGLAILREVLKDISFRLHKRSFKSAVRGDAVWIYLMRANNGTQEAEASAKAKLSLLDDALKMPRDAFRERLERFLRENGFEL